MEPDVPRVLLLQEDLDLVVSKDHFRHRYVRQDFLEMLDLLGVEDGQSLGANVPLVVDADRWAVFYG